MSRRKQTQIPGTERPSIDEIDEHAGSYCELFYESKDLLAKSNKVKILVAEKMMKHGLDVYKYQDDVYVYTFRFKQGDPKLECERQPLED